MALNSLGGLDGERIRISGGDGLFLDDYDEPEIAPTPTPPGPPSYQDGLPPMPPSPPSPAPPSGYYERPPQEGYVNPGEYTGGYTGGYTP